MLAHALPSLLLAGGLLAAAAAVAEPGAFAAEWQRWHARRLERLRAEDGWLALVGLHWLEPGPNRVEGLPGTFTLDGERVAISASTADGYALDGAPVTARALAGDGDAKPDVLTLGATRRVAVIARGGRRALRVWDAASPVRRGFQGIAAFPPDPRWRIAARWEAYPAPRPVEVPSVVGIPEKALVPGRAVFTIDGREYALEPTQAAATRPTGPLFFVFKDRTARAETYGAGRFLLADPPRDGQVVLDFNRAYNPPCAFTPYATCPLPPPGNVLPLRIEAGEQRWSGH